MKKVNPNSLNIDDMSITDIINLPYSEVIRRVQTGGWGLAHFAHWAEDRINFAYGDGYEDGYSVAERVADEKNAAKLN